MSIAPPSDIVMDVAQAADPLKLRQATDRLARAAAAAGGADFDTVLAAGSGSAGPAALPAAALRPSLPFHGPLSGLAARGAEGKQATTDRKFEAMVLQSFVENILPKDSNLFGDAASADMCRSLLAEQLATQLAKAGGIGIAKSLERFQDRAQEASTTPAPNTPLSLLPPTGRGA